MNCILLPSYIESVSEDEKQAIIWNKNVLNFILKINSFGNQPDYMLLIFPIHSTDYSQYATSLMVIA